MKDRRAKVSWWPMGTWKSAIWSWFWKFLFFYFNFLLHFSLVYICIIRTIQCLTCMKVRCIREHCVPLIKPERYDVVKFKFHPCCESGCARTQCLLLKAPVFSFSQCLLCKFKQNKCQTNFSDNLENRKENFFLTAVWESLNR